MKAHARVVACVRDGTTRVVVQRSEPPLVLRNTPDALYLVGGAGGPLGGDDLTLDIEVGAGASLCIRSAAAQVALPGPHGETSRFAVQAHVESGGTLRWQPEPSIAAEGCRHEVVIDMRVGEGARIEWRDEVVLGRQGEGSGSWRTRMDVDYVDRPLLRHSLRVGGGRAWDGPAIVGDAGAVGAILLIGDNAPLPREPGEGCAVMDLAGPGVLVMAVAREALELRARLERPTGFNGYESRDREARLLQSTAG